MVASFLQGEINQLVYRQLKSQVRHAFCISPPTLVRFELRKRFGTAEIDRSEFSLYAVATVLGETGARFKGRRLKGAGDASPNALVPDPDNRDFPVSSTHI